MRSTASCDSVGGGGGLFDVEVCGMLLWLCVKHDTTNQTATAAAAAGWTHEQPKKKRQPPPGFHAIRGKRRR